MCTKVGCFNRQRALFARHSLQAYDASQKVLPYDQRKGALPAPPKPSLWNICDRKPTNTECPATALIYH